MVVVWLRGGVAVAVHLWNIPAHREAWKRVAHEQGGYGQLYQHFAHFLETDAIYLLNDAMEILPKGAYTFHCQSLQHRAPLLC